MHRIAMLGMILTGCGDDGSAGDDRGQVHLTQEGDGSIWVTASFNRNPGEDNTIQVRMLRTGTFGEYLTDATVTAGPPGAEQALVVDSVDPFFVGSWPGESSLVHVHAEWASGSADIVVPIPQTVTLLPDPIIAFTPLTIAWPSWQAHRNDAVDIRAGNPNSTLQYGAFETELDVVTSHVVPKDYVPPSDAYHVRVTFDGEFVPTGGVGGADTPNAFVRHQQLLERMVPLP